MSLPRLETPIHTFILPSTKEKITYRPFLVKEEKILSLAYKEIEFLREREKAGEKIENIENAQADILITALREIAKTTTFNKADVSKWTAFDMDYFYLMLRCRSKGPIVDLVAKCDCGHSNKFNIDLEKSTYLDTSAETSKNVKFKGTNMGIVLKYPSFDQVAEILSSGDSNADNYYDLLMELTESVYDGDNVTTEFDKKDFEGFIESLRSEDLEAIRNFFRGAPKVKIKVSYTCEKCNKKHDAQLEGIESFFD